MTQIVDPVARLNELIKGIDVAMLSTVRPDGTMHSCPMAAQPADSNGAVWLLSGSTSEKAEAIRTSPRVSLSYVDHPGQRYVSISGFCELVRDRARAKELWKSQYKAWLPGGAEDPNLIFLKIGVQHVEYWDAAQGRMIELFGFAQAAMR